MKPGQGGALQTNGFPLHRKLEVNCLSLPKPKGAKLCVRQFLFPPFGSIDTVGSTFLHGGAFCSNLGQSRTRR